MTPQQYYGYPEGDSELKKQIKEQFSTPIRQDQNQNRIMSTSPRIVKGQGSQNLTPLRNATSRDTLQNKVIIPVEYNQDLRNTSKKYQGSGSQNLLSPDPSPMKSAGAISPMKVIKNYEYPSKAAKTEPLYDNKSLSVIPGVVNPEHLSREEKEKYDKLIETMEKYWLEADRSNYQHVKDSGNKRYFEFDGSQFEIDYDPGTEYMLGSNGERLPVPKWVRELVANKEDEVQKNF